MYKVIIIVLGILFFACSSNKAKDKNDSEKEKEEILISNEIDEEEISEIPEIPDSVVTNMGKRLIVGYEGQIDTYPIKMKLEFTLSPEKSIWGDYFYLRSGNKSKISVSGKFLTNDSILLEERYYNHDEKRYVVTGYFSGKLDKNYNLKGVWTDSAATKSLPLRLTSTIKDFHHNLNFEFVTTEDYDIYDENPLYYENVLQLKEVLVKDKGGKIIQKLTDLNKYIRKGDETIALIDLNFDGYMDLAVNYIFPGRWKNDWGQLYFLYNPHTKKFERNHELEIHEVIFVDYFTKTVKKILADGSGNESDSYYSYINGHYYLTKEEFWTEDGGHTIINYEVRDGESVEISREEKK